ncbi:MAG: RNA 2',3'-cyclic phosphodiesterase [Candidatus Babeliales bacterium]
MPKIKKPKIRLFISIAIPEKIKEVLRNISKEVKKENLIEAQWVAPEHQHVTLHFLGYVARDFLPEIEETLRQIPFEPFRVTLGPLGLNDAANPRVIWVNVDSPMLNWLAQEIITMLSPFVEPPEREFHGHSTLARIKKVHNQDGLRSLIDSYRVAPDSWAVEQFFLMESPLDQAGTVYREIALFKASEE